MARVLTTDLYLDVVTDAVAAIATVAEGHLEAPIEHCPGFDIAKLLEHTGAFGRIVEARVGRDEEWKPASGTWQVASDEVGDDPLGWHRTWTDALCGALRAANPAERARTWAGYRTRYFWFRRAAQELSMHRWDAEHAVGPTTPFDPRVALDGLDEFLGEFAKRAAPLLAGRGQTFQFVADDIGVAYTVTTHTDRWDLHTAQEPNVEARASAEVLFRFVWGRATPDELAVSGNASLLERWQERVRL